MGLIKSTIRDRARVLLNEIVEGFWLNSELEQFIDDAAIDISTKTYCYELSKSVTMSTSTQLYTVSTDCLKILGAVYANKGLKRSAVYMEGLQTAVVSGAPEYFFEIINKLGLIPVPSSSENSKVITVYYAETTNNIRNIPLKFQISAVLYTIFMGLLKERQYAKAGQLYATYTTSLNLDKVEVTSEKLDVPPAQDHYILKLMGPQK